MIVEGLFFLFLNFSLKQYVVTPHLNHLTEMVQMRGHNMFQCRTNKNYPELSSNTPSYLELRADIVRRVCRQWLIILSR